MLNTSRVKASGGGIRHIQWQTSNLVLCSDDYTLAGRKLKYFLIFLRIHIKPHNTKIKNSNN